MMNPWHLKTPEERLAMAQKGRDTRHRNRMAEAARQQELRDRIDPLRREIAALEQRLAALKTMEAVTLASAALTGKALLREQQITEAAVPWAFACGVYFLIKSGRVVYVGQSVNVHARLGQHKEKDFDSYAYVPCQPQALDCMESLYIHALRPPLNGEMPSGAKMAPMSLMEVCRIQHGGQAARQRVAANRSNP
jgi:hypothetical protein